MRIRGTDFGMWSFSVGGQMELSDRNRKMFTCKQTISLLASDACLSLPGRRSGEWNLAEPCRRCAGSIHTVTRPACREDDRRYL